MRVERRYASDRKRCLGAWGFVRRLDGRYVRVQWNNGIETRVRKVSLRPYQADDHGAAHAAS